MLLWWLISSNITFEPLISTQYCNGLGLDNEIASEFCEQTEIQTLSSSLSGT